MEFPSRADQKDSRLQADDVAGVVEMALEDDNLVVKATSLPGCDFLGLFANRDFSADELVCVYYGVILRTVEALRLSDKSYLMRLGEQCYVNALDNKNCFARYINDCINPRGWNVWFDKRPDDKCAHVHALRNIRKGEEIFVNYGKWYWVKLKPVRIDNAFFTAVSGRAAAEEDNEGPPEQV